MTRPSLRSAVSVLLASLGPLTAQDTRSYADELPRFPAVPAERALATMIVQPGFRLELAAAEPEVHDPVAMAFDEDSRLFVVEMRGYSEQRDEQRGAVRVLEDGDRDGRFEKSTVLVDKLPWPTAVACWQGGAFVAVPPDIWYFKDTDGDGRADVREQVYTGFSHYNVQAMVNSFRWGLDNRLHGAASSGGGEMARVGEADQKPLRLRLRDFAFDPRTRDFSATTEGGQHGMGFDDWGRKFSCSNSDHLKQVIYEERYLARNPWFSAPDARVSIAAEGQQPEVFRISPVEPWRILRTKLRLEGTLMQFKLEGGGRAAGYFTAATGITIYRGDAWPAEHRGMAIVGDVGGNLIHRNRLEPNGVEFIGRRIDPDSEFVASRDTWFRPVQFVNGPDGTLYAADMYREIIEHPWSFGDEIKPHLHLTSGRDRGRIYRITHTNAADRVRLPRLGGKKSSELVPLLAHDNAWHRATAARLLFERQDRRVVPALRKLLRDSAKPLGRLHSLYALKGLDSLLAPDVATALADAHGGVRAHAVKLAEGLVAADGDLRRRLAGLSRDPELTVRVQLAFTLGELPAADRIGPLTELARRDAGDKWVRAALLTSLREGAGAVFAALAEQRDWRSTPDARIMLRELARMIARKNDAAEFAAMLDRFAVIPEDELALSVVLGIREGVGSRRTALLEPSNLAPGARRFRALLNGALAVTGDDRRDLAERQDAVHLAGLLPFDRAWPAMQRLLGAGEPEALQKSVLEVAGRFRDDAVTRALVEVFPRLSPGLRTAAVDALFLRRERSPLILDAVERGDLNPGDLNAVQIQRLCLSKDEAEKARAIRLLSPARENNRSKVIEAYQSALTLPGDIGRGRTLYRTVCATCHRAEEVGNVVGPNPATFRNRGTEWMLVNILDPNREVNPEFANYTLATRDDREIAGLITGESASSIIVTRADGGQETVLRRDVAELTASRLSLMPEGLEQTINPAAMADLLAYLNSLK